jgi:hypothetical protein
VTGCKRSDHVTVSELNSRAKFPLLNELVTQTVAMETWAAFHSSKGSARGRNPLGVKMFESSGFTRESRATAAGKVTGISYNAFSANPESPIMPFQQIRNLL